MKKGVVKSGFTLIELTLAIAFVSVLLITISLITSEIVKLYRKGYTIKTVNQVGRDLIEDLTSAVLESNPAKAKSLCRNYISDSARAACEADNGREFIYHEFFSPSSDTITIQAPGATAATVSSVPLYGYFCTGKYSYVWRTGYLSSDSYTVSGSTLQDLSRDVSSAYHRMYVDYDEYKLLKIEDKNFAICAAGASASAEYPTQSGASLEAPRNIDLAALGLSDPVELIAESDSPLALYDFTIFPPAIVSTTGRFFLSGSFILGTVEGGINIMTNSNYCQTSETYNSIDFSYCAINKFDFSTQASGSSDV